MGLRKTKTVEFMGRNVTVQELDVAQIADFFSLVRDQAKQAQDWLRRVDPGDPPPGYEPHVLDILMNGKIPFAQVLQCVPGLTERDLCGPGVSASDLAPIYQAVEEVNPFLLRAGESVMAAVERAEAAERPRPSARRTTGAPV